MLRRLRKRRTALRPPVPNPTVYCDDVPTGAVAFADIVKVGKTI
jgi:hypothetical protein